MSMVGAKESEWNSAMSRGEKELKAIGSRADRRHSSVLATFH
jgi:hypothetical protein